MNAGPASEVTFPSTTVGRVAEIRLGKMLQPKPSYSEDTEVHYLRAGSLEDLGEAQALRKMWASAAERAAYNVRQGDLVVAEGGDVGRSAFVPDVPPDTIIQNSLHRVRPRAGDARFLKYALDATYYSGWLDVLCNKATFGHLTREKLAALSIPWPPGHQQQTIADFLDDQAARIRTLVNRKRQVIEVLRLRRTALARAVLRGAEVPGPRKPSGLPWLGTIPAGWALPAVGHRFEVRLGRMINQERARGAHLRPYLRNLNVGWGRITLDDVALMDFPPAERRRYALRSGDLLVCEGGAGVAEAAVWNGEMGECYYQKSLHRVRPRGEWPVEWIAEWLRVWKAVGAHQAEGNLATIPHLTAEQFRAHRVPMPEPATCRRLLRRLHAQEATMNNATKSMNCQLQLLEEHRQALITAAVMGRLEIPGAAT